MSAETHTTAHPNAEGLDALTPPDARAVLQIDLDALRSNWRKLNEKAGAAECAGVIKADAYGLGIEPICRALIDEGDAGPLALLLDALDGLPGDREPYQPFDAGGLAHRAQPELRLPLDPGATFIARSAEYTPPVIYSLEERAKLVYLIEARPDDPSKLRVGQPVTVTREARP